MFKQLSTFAVASGMAAVVSTGGLFAAPQPAAAQSQGTVNTILGGAAAIGALILYNNYQHKKQAANSVVGYTQTGGTIYGDGRIVMANGQTVYPNQQGQYPNGQYAYYNPNVNPNAYQYDTARTGRYDRTYRHTNGYSGNVPAQEYGNNGNHYGRDRNRNDDDRRGNDDERRGNDDKRHGEHRGDDRH